MYNLKEKTAIVTGGAQGIGKGIVKELLQHGMNVIIADVNAQEAEQTVQEYCDIGPLRFIQTDTTLEMQIENLIEKTIDAFGSIDALINNAARTKHINKPIEHMDIDEWNNILANNITGYFLCAKHTIKHLRHQKGSIVNIASTRALQSELNTEAYSTTKGAILSLTHSLAMSLGPDIRVNAISPGWIDVQGWGTHKAKEELRPIDYEQHPVNRIGEPEDIASLTAYLISEKAKFITAQNFVVDGGMTKKMIYAE